MEKKKNGLWVYLALTFVLTWTYMFALVWPAAKGDQTTYALLLTGCMFFPAACMFLTRLLTREGFRDLMIRPRFKGNGRTYLLAYFGPFMLAVLGAALYYLMFPDKLDWSAPVVRQAMAEAGNPYEAQSMPMRTLLIIQVMQALLLPGLANLIPALGEEWGWRGYMMPRLRDKLRPLPALIAGGTIWGL